VALQKGHLRVGGQSSSRFQGPQLPIASDRLVGRRAVQDPAHTPARRSPGRLARLPALEGCTLEHAVASTRVRAQRAATTASSGASRTAPAGARRLDSPTAEAARGFVERGCERRRGGRDGRRAWRRAPSGTVPPA
jgi:hypothetical protein